MSMVDTRTESPPRFVRLRQMQRDRYMRQPAGSTVRLRCRADAVPPASVIWLKDRRILPTRADHDAAAAAEEEEDDDRSVIDRHVY